MTTNPRSEANKPTPAIEPQGWAAFQQAGLLWWVNRTLHLFGWVLVFEADAWGEEPVRVYPARTRWRGFAAADEAVGFELLTEHLVESAPRLLLDVREGDR